MKFISIPIFIISLALGLFLTYITAPEPKVIYVYPTPDNVDKIQYVDKANTCYKLSATEVKCPSDPKKIATPPMQY